MTVISIASPQSILAIILEPKRPKTHLRTCAPSKDSDQPAHLRSLTRNFTVRILDSQGCEVSSCRQRRLWSDCADVQSDLSLRWAHMSDGTFSDIAAHLILPSYLHLKWGACQKKTIAFHENGAKCKLALNFVQPGQPVYCSLIKSSNAIIFCRLWTRTWSGPHRLV